MASLKITTGLKTYDIEDENGNVRGQISFNPSDVNFYPRAQAFYDNVIALANSLGEVEPTPELIKEADEKIKAELNELFGSDVSSVVFGAQNALNSFNGKMFVERFIEAILPIIEADTKAEMKKSAERVAKYTAQVK